jgi:hypothetical protein
MRQELAQLAAFTLHTPRVTAFLPVLAQHNCPFVSDFILHFPLQATPQASLS